MTGEWDHIKVDPARVSPPPAIDGTFILDDVQAWYREHGDKLAVWPQRARVHSHTWKWMGTQWSAPADDSAASLSGAIGHLGVPVDVDDSVPSGILRTLYTDGSERDERVYGDQVAFALALRDLGRAMLRASGALALADWLNRKLSRGEPQP